MVEKKAGKRGKEAEGRGREKKQGLRGKYRVKARNRKSKSNHVEHNMRIWKVLNK